MGRRWVFVGSLLAALLVSACLGIQTGPGGGSPGAEPQPALQPEPGQDDPAKPDVQPVPVPPVKDRVTRVPVLAYHDLKPGAGQENGAVISTEEFEEQMRWLAENGYKAITTEELALWMQGALELPPKPVLITFDDGYESNYIYAMPVLKQAGLRATLFMIGSTAGKTLGGFTHVTWDQLREMRASGVFEIQSHTMDGHMHIDRRPALIAWTAEEIKADDAVLRRAYRENGLPEPTALAYPFGARDAETVAAMSEAGIRLAFTVEHGFARPDSPPMEIKRIVIYPGTSVCQFADRIGGACSKP